MPGINTVRTPSTSMPSRTQQTQHLNWPHSQDLLCHRRPIHKADLPKRIPNNTPVIVIRQSACCSSGYAGNWLSTRMHSSAPWLPTTQAPLLLSRFICSCTAVRPPQATPLGNTCRHEHPHKALIPMSTSVLPMRTEHIQLHMASTVLVTQSRKGCMPRIDLSRK
jgi:hypothetical protein